MKITPHPNPLPCLCADTHRQAQGERETYVDPVASYRELQVKLLLAESLQAKEATLRSSYPL